MLHVYLEQYKYHVIIAPQLLRYSFFGTEFGILKWNFDVLFPVYFNVNFRNKMEIKKKKKKIKKQRQFLAF